MSGENGKKILSSILIEQGLLISKGISGEENQSVLIGSDLSFDCIFKYSVQFLQKEIFQVPFLSSFQTSLSFYEVYCDQIGDLLSNKWHLKILNNDGKIQIKVEKNHLQKLIKRICHGDHLMMWDKRIT